jgi:hypothetical protein
MQALYLGPADGTYGAAPTTPTWTPIRYTSFGGGLAKDTFTSEEVRSDRAISDVRHGAKKPKFDIGFELSYGSFDTILAAVLCSTWDTDVLTSGVTRSSYCLERKFADLLEADKPYHRFLGTEFNSMQLTIGVGGMIKGTFGCIAQDMTLAGTAIANSTYSAAATTSPFDAFTGVLEEGGGSIAIVSEVQINLENGLEPSFVIGSPLTLRPSIGRSKLTGTLMARFENATLLEKFTGETESSLVVTLTDAATNELEISLPRIKYTGGTPDMKGEGPITISMPFEALYDSGDETNITITRTAA